MPNYSFLDESTGIYEDVFFKFSDAPPIGSYITYEGRKLRRQATIPCASSDSVITDYHSEKEFIRATNKSGTMGQLWDKSKEFSERRAEKEGRDVIKEKYEAEKGVGGVPQASAKPKESALLKKLGIKIKK